MVAVFCVLCFCSSMLQEPWAAKLHLCQTIPERAAGAIFSAYFFAVPLEIQNEGGSGVWIDRKIKSSGAMFVSVAFNSLELAGRLVRKKFVVDRKIKRSICLCSEKALLFDESSSCEVCG
ncbi:hypothetical protein METBIDRAFT_219965 [Metschnikowia bicuspidata var. bicuspidata NRRL YB-4993]|uniref:Secreted protein n=1 Tax=Metschnikowia bicuspidata var. bicuspidata NRRL YB-4993 TaxID=869754 RepID=A0A1A0H5G9_9ASCO|nr:hypothetical protein METBIDRAFT_219965 [Metschnikowia bicuspidata var. bicuspidata NRRL YB-4993]OBA19190.1 hypothetical protein METBIDRAFT_219965 [Metschnikowia bicuspidata var. bicuspidata NRRL YB-4993]